MPDQPAPMTAEEIDYTAEYDKAVKMLEKERQHLATNESNGHHMAAFASLQRIDMLEQRCKLFAEIQQLQQRNTELLRTNHEEIDEFNAGFQACQDGLDVDEAEMRGDFPHDQFRPGYAWCWWLENHAKYQVLQRDRDTLTAALRRVYTAIVEQCGPRHSGNSLMGFRKLCGCGSYWYNGQAEHHTDVCIVDKARRWLQQGEQPTCPHPADRLHWHDGSLKCYQCSTIWHDKEQIAREVPQAMTHPTPDAQPTGGAK